MGKINLIHGDCIIKAKDIDVNSIDAIICDLPYGTTSCSWDTIIPFNDLWKIVDYVLKPNGVFITTAMQPFTSSIIMSNVKKFKYELVWNKGRGTSPGVAKYRPMPCHESVLVFADKKIKYNPQFKNGEPYIKKSSKAIQTGKNHKFRFKEITTVNNGFRHPLSIIDIPFSPTKKIHPTEKPLELMSYLINTYTDIGDNVLDITMGSGTTGVSCVLNNRNFVGIENDEEYFAIAEERIWTAKRKYDFEQKSTLF